MSGQNVEAFKRGMAAAERRDIDAFLDEVDGDVEWQPVLPVLLGGEATMYRGHQGVRDLFREVDAAFAEFHVEVSEIRDLGDRLIASGRTRARQGERRGNGLAPRLPGRVQGRQGVSDPELP